MADRDRGTERFVEIDPTEVERVRTGLVTAEEALEIAHRFVNGHFRNGKEGPRISIPADPMRDDDLRLVAFIEQSAAEIERLKRDLEGVKEREREHVTRAQDVADEMRRERDAAIDSSNATLLGRARLQCDLDFALAREAAAVDARIAALAERDALQRVLDQKDDALVFKRLVGCELRLDALTAERDAAIAERDELRRRLESMPPWPEEGEPLDDEQMRALMLRWSTGPELYQADADALIASLRMARAELDDTRAERDQLRQRLRLTEETLIAEVGERGPAAAAVDRIRVAETERDRLRTELEALRESARADMYRFDPTWRCDRIAQCITAILTGAKS